jgi:hypothetical protein
MMGGTRWPPGSYVGRDEGPLSGVTARPLMVPEGVTPLMLCEPFPFEESLNAK